MMRNCFLALGFHFLHEVVQKEVNQNGIDFNIWMVPFDLPSDQLDTPNAAGYRLLVSHD